MKKNIFSVSVMRVMGMFYIALILHILPIYFRLQIRNIMVLHVVGELFSFLGVGTFFAVSGYLLGDYTKGTPNAVAFDVLWFLKRCLKILIPYESILVIILLIKKCCGDNVDILTVIISIFNLQGVFQLKYSFAELGHTWFISILMICYILVPLLKRINHKYKCVYYSVLVAVIMIFSFFWDITSAAYTSHILLFSIMYFYRRDQELVLRDRICKIPNAIYLVIIIFMMSLRIVTSFGGDSVYYYLVICLTGIINCITYNFFMIYKVTYSNLINHNIWSKLIDNVSNISYEFYLIHGVLISGTTSIVGIFDYSRWEIIIIIMLSIILSGVLKVVSSIPISWNKKYLSI